MAVHVARSAQAAACLESWAGAGVLQSLPQDRREGFICFGHGGARFRIVTELPFFAAGHTARTCSALTETRFWPP